MAAARSESVVTMALEERESDAQSKPAGFEEGGMFEGLAASPVDEIKIAAPAAEAAIADESAKSDQVDQAVADAADAIVDETMASSSTEVFVAANPDTFRTAESDTAPVEPDVVVSAAAQMVDTLHSGNGPPETAATNRRPPWPTTKTARPCCS
jgi:hypothetical protein